MKKVLVFVLLLCVLGVVFCACNYVGQSQEPLSDNENSTPSAVIEEPQDSCSYAFNSYQEVAKALMQKQSKEYSKLREEQNAYGTVYKTTLSKFASADIKVAVPQINENPITLRNKDGYANISLLTSELYNLPWLWYHCVIDDQNLDVKMSYLDAGGALENKSAVTYTDVLRLIAPEAPSPKNYEKFESYKTIYEKKITLQDGVTVTAMISELKDSSKMYVMFYHDGLLVSLYGEKTMFADGFWSSFGIAYAE